MMSIECAWQNQSFFLLGCTSGLAVSFLGTVCYRELKLHIIS